MNLRLQLQIVGGLQVLLALAHLAFPRRFGWREELVRLSPLNRQIFYVHAFFICLVLVLFGLLDLIYTDELLEPGSLARGVLAGITVFWTTRLFCQWFVYDSKLWLGHRFNTAMHVVATFLWSYFVAMHGGVLWRQIVR
jgi:hypothetical protein